MAAAQRVAVILPVLIPVRKLRWQKVIVLHLFLTFSWRILL